MCQRKQGGDRHASCHASLRSAMALNVGRFASRTVCACSSAGSRTPGSPCERCGLAIPDVLDELSFEERRRKVESAPRGSPLALYGLHFELGDDHLRPSEIDGLAKIGDPLGDSAVAALRALRVPNTVDALVRAAKNGDPACRALLDSVNSLPSWADRSRLDNAGRLWFSHFPCLAVSLLHLSLLGSFTAPAINATLITASRLASSRDVVYRRVIETLEFVNDVCLPNALEIEGAGWRAAMSVRLIHAAARAKVRKARASGAPMPGGCPAGAAAGPPGEQPISVAYMLSESANRWSCSLELHMRAFPSLAVTQLAFSIHMFLGAERAGLLWHIDDNTCADYCHLFAVVNYYLGVPEHLSSASKAGSLRGSQVLFESLFVGLCGPGPHTRMLSLASLRACAWRAPFPMSPSDMVGVLHVLGGPRLAALAMPAFYDPQLDAPIVENNPSTSLRSELVHVRTSDAEQAIDSSSRLRKMPWRDWAGTWFEVVLFHILALLMVLASWMSWAKDSLQGFRHRAFDSRNPAVDRGHYILSLQRGWAAFSHALPRGVQRWLGRMFRAFLIAHVRRRLGGEHVDTHTEAEVRDAPASIVFYIIMRCQ